MVSAGRHEGHRRAQMVEQLAKLLANGGGLRASLRQVAAQHDVNWSSLYRWARRCSGEEQARWVDLLMPARLRPGMRRGRENLWRSMRILRSFTCGDLAATAECSVSTAGHYVNRLLHAGYVRQHKEPGIGRRGPRGVRFILVRDTGPVAPVARRDGSVYDPNFDLVFTEVIE